MLKRLRGQSTFEYAAMVTIIIAALLTIGIYFKRGIQGRWKSAVDDLGDQYDPRLTNTDITHRMVGNSVTQVTTVAAPGGLWTMRYDNSTSTDTRVGNMRVGSSN